MMNLLLIEQLPDGLNGFMKFAKKLKMNNDLEDLSLRLLLTISKKFVVLSMMILMLQ